jgi:hypothetical protein
MAINQIKSNHFLHWVTRVSRQSWEGVQGEQPNLIMINVVSTKRSSLFMQTLATYCLIPPDLVLIGEILLRQQCGIPQVELIREDQMDLPQSAIGVFRGFGRRVRDVFP